MKRQTWDESFDPELIYQDGSDVQLLETILLKFDFRKLWRRMKQKDGMRTGATVTRRLTTTWTGRFQESLNRMEYNRGVIPGGCPRWTLTPSFPRESLLQPTLPLPQQFQAEIGRDIPPRHVGRSWGWRTRCTRWTGEGWRWRSPSTSPTTFRPNSSASLMKKASWSATGEPNIIFLLHRDEAFHKMKNWKWVFIKRKYSLEKFPNNINDFFEISSPKPVDRISLKTRHRSQQKTNFLKLITLKPRSMWRGMYSSGKDRCKATHLRLSFCLGFSSIRRFLAQDAQHRILGTRNHWILQDLRPGQGEDCTEVQRVPGADGEAQKR